MLVAGYCIVLKNDCCCYHPLLQIMAERKNAKAVACSSLPERTNATLDVPLQGTLCLEYYLECMALPHSSISINMVCSYYHWQARVSGLGAMDLSLFSTESNQWLLIVLKNHSKTLKAALFMAWYSVHVCVLGEKGILKQSKLGRLRCLVRQHTVVT